MQHIHFVTGRLAEHAVRKQVATLAQQVGFDYSISVLPITVAALITSKWLQRHLIVPDEATRVILPGHLHNDIPQIQSWCSAPVECGPRDIRDLPRFFGKNKANSDSYGAHTIDILAEINHAPRLTLDQLLAQANEYRRQGADVIDLGCTPGHCWTEVGDAVKALIDAGLRVSIDSFDRKEVELAVRAGAELVLSVNQSNCEAACDWGVEVVVIPDTPDDEKSLEATIIFLAKRDIPLRIDPILEPIGFGFMRSLERYSRCRSMYPDASMMMGIGNITELTDVDSAGINVILLGICEELRINSVLTTAVIPWAQTSVKECDLARRLVHYAIENRVPPKHLEDDLVMLRDTKRNSFDSDTIRAMGELIRDRNVRIFASEGKIHAISGGVYARDEDPFVVMQQLLESEMGTTIDPSHAFYLGFEMAKALTANTLGKQYEQDQALNWGFLTRTEDHHRLARKRADRE